MSKDNNNLTILPGQSVLLPSQNEIQRRIYSIRGVQVMLDRDLAQASIISVLFIIFDYYMFRLTEEEWNNWKSQFVTSNYMSEDEIQAIKMGVRRPPFAFTEQGVYMLMTVLKGELAIKQSKALIRIFGEVQNLHLTNLKAIRV